MRMMARPLAILLMAFLVSGPTHAWGAPPPRPKPAPQPAVPETPPVPPSSPPVPEPAPAPEPAPVPAPVPAPEPAPEPAPAPEPDPDPQPDPKPEPEPLPEPEPRPAPAPEPAPAPQPSPAPPKPTPAAPAAPSAAPQPVKQPAQPRPQPARIDKARRVASPEPGADLPRDIIRVVLPESRSDLLGAAEAPSQDANDPLAASLPREAGLPRAGRMILFLKAVDSEARGAPADAPFFEDPQPLGSIAVAELRPGSELEFDGQAIWWPGPPDWLDGLYDLQVVFDRSDTERGHRAPDNLISDPVRIAFDSSREDATTVTLNRRIEQVPPENRRNITWYQRKSPLLSEAAGRDIMHKAAVVVPRDYDNIHAERRFWPTVYVVPGFGGRWTDALRIAELLARSDTRDILPQAVHVVLDPESAWGHHGFVDSAANGPRGTALVTELIPALEERFRLVREPAARVVTGHSSGGWTALWLLTQYPDTFGMALSSAPDPVDFSAFQTIDLYRDANLFTDASGDDHPAMRIPLGPGHDLVPMTVREEIAMERAISPRGASGEQWDAWAAMWSPMDDRTGAPRRIANPVTGQIDPVTAEAWSAFDITRLARNDDRIADTIATRAQVLCGDRDSFYLDRAATRLRDLLFGRDRGDSMGLIEILPDLDHGTMGTLAAARFHRQIREHFVRSGLTGPDRAPPGPASPESPEPPAVADPIPEPAEPTPEPAEPMPEPVVP